MCVVHGADGDFVLVADGGFGAAALGGVAGDAAGEAGFVFEVDEDAGGGEDADGFPVEGVEALEDDVLGGGDRLDAG